MTLPLELEDWLTETGDNIVRKKAAGGIASLSVAERLLYEVWLLDTEVRNGGLSQYFGNRGIARWRELANLATADVIPCFPAFAKQLDKIIGSSSNPYQVLISRGAEPDELYEKYQEKIVRELRQFYANAA
jgi:hypothetical protein